MTANDVYNIAKALSQEELIRLCDMLEIKMQPKTINKKRKPLPDFTVEDGIRYLMKNHLTRVRTP